MDPAVVAGVIAGCSLWLAGWPDRARARLRQGLNLARERGHLYSLCMALVCAARLYLWCGALEEAERLIEEGVSLAHVHGVVALRVQGSIHQGCICVQRGEPEAGLSLLTEGIPQYRGMGVLYALPSQLCFVADAYRQLGRVEEGLATVAEAVRLTETYANVWWAAEVYRLKGEMLLTAAGQSTTNHSTGRS
jgi:hypothetical protein